MATSLPPWPPENTGKAGPSSTTAPSTSSSAGSAVPSSSGGGGGGKVNPFRTPDQLAGQGEAPAGNESALELVGRVQAAVGQLLSAVDALEGSREDMDSVHDTAVAVKGVRSSMDTIHYALRDRLWNAVGGKCGKYTTPSGDKVEFRRSGTVRRKTSYKTLQEQFPLAYEAAVTETPVDLSTPGNLYL